ncbi:MAG: hypothetical protein ACFFCS_21615 [Candidatus Hodarchaeota archaeon]
MPTMKRIILKNIGHPKALFEDLEINCRTMDIKGKKRGSDTYILAANGVGKTSLIGLVFSVIRPMAYEFPRGEGNQRRRFKDYVPSKGTCHVMIEWILDETEDGIPKMLLTGMVAERRSRDHILQLFYSSNYLENTKDNELTPDNFPVLNENDEYLSISEIKEFFRKNYKSQDLLVNYTEKKSEWEDFLKLWYIEPELYRIQATMNQRESSQDAMLNFGTNEGLIKHLVGLITPFENTDQDKETVNEVKEHFEELKEIPSLREQKEFIMIILKKLGKGREIQKSRDAVKNKLHENLTNLEREIFTGMGEIRKISYFVDNKRDIVVQKQQDLVEVKNKVEVTEKEILVAKHRLITSKSTQKKNEDTELKKKEQELKHTKTLLGALIPYREYLKSRTRCEHLQNQLKEAAAPLEKTYHESALLYGLKLGVLIDQKRSYLEKLKDEKEAIGKDKDEKNKELGSLETFIKSTRSRKEKITSKIDRINKVHEGFIGEKILLPGEIPPDAIVRMETNRDEIIEIVDKMGEEIKISNEKLVKEEISSVHLENRIEETRRNVNLLKNNERTMKNAWNALSNHELFRTEFPPALINSHEPNYDLVNLRKIEDVESEINKTYLEKLSMETRDEIISRELEYFKTQKHFPPHNDILTLLSHLDQVQVLSTYGWSYLLENYRENPEKINYWVTNYPHILDGVIVFNHSPDEIKHLVYEKFKSFKPAIPIYISSPDVLSLDLPPVIDDDKIKILYEHLEFRYKKTGLLTRKEELENERGVLTAKIQDFDAYLEKRRDFVKEARNFLAKYNKDTFSENQADIDNLKNTLIELEEDKTEKQKIIRDLKLKLDDLKYRHESELKNNESVNNDIRRIDKFCAQWDEKQELEEELQDKIKEIAEKLEDKTNLEEIINNINIKMEKLEEIILIETKLITARENEREKLPEFVKTTIEEEPSINDRFSEIKNKNIDELQSTFEQAAKDLQTNPTTLQMKAELEKEQREAKTKSKQAWNRLDYQKIPWNEGKTMESFNNKNANLSIEEIQKKEQNLEEQKEDILKRRTSLKNTLDELGSKIQVLEKELLEKEVEIPETTKEGEVDDLEANVTSLESHLKYSIEMKESLIEEIKDINKDINSLLESCKELKLVKKRADENLLMMSTQVNYQNKIIDRGIPEFGAEQAIDQYEIRAKNISSNLESYIARNLELNEAWLRVNEKASKFIKKFKEIANPNVWLHLRTTGLLNWVMEFSAESLEDVATHIKHYETRKETITSTLEEHDAKLDNIVKVFYSKVLSILENINDLVRTKVPVPVNGTLENKHILEITSELDIKRSEDMKLVENRIKLFFEKLGKEKKFPSKLEVYEILMKELVREAVESKIKKIRFLIPRPGNLRPEYRDLIETLKASGGETTTVAILLYCLIAHFRMKQIHSLTGKHKKATSTFIMDNPFGKANRYDLVEVQTNLAKALDIQLIVFSGYENANIFYQFDTLQPLRAYMYNNETIVELDEENARYKIEGGSITFDENNEEDE